MSAPRKLNAIQRAFRFTGMESGRGFVFFTAFVAFNLGSVFDRSDTHKMVFFRDRSRLYGRELKEGEAPTWPSNEMYWN